MPVMSLKWLLVSRIEYLLLYASDSGLRIVEVLLGEEIRDVDKRIFSLINSYSCHVFKFLYDRMIIA